MKIYPICLVGLEQRRAVVIGGGSVAARKAEALLEAGANVQAISPDFCQAFLALSSYPNLQWVQRPYQEGDLDSAFLVIAATDEAAVNQAVYQAARRAGCLVNVVDDPQHCDFILPAVVEHGPLKVAISTGGTSPALARRLRQILAEAIGPEYGALAELLGELRPELQSRFPPGEARLQAAMRLIDDQELKVLLTASAPAITAPARQRARQLLAQPAEGAVCPEIRLEAG